MPIDRNEGCEEGIAAVEDGRGRVSEKKQPSEKKERKKISYFFIKIFDDVDNDVAESIKYLNTWLPSHCPRHRS